MLGVESQYIAIRKINMDALTIIVPVVTAMLTAFVTHYLTRSYYEKKRQDDLADREFARRAAVYDMRIQEAREVLEKFTTIISLSSEYFRVIDEEENLDSAHDLLSFHDEEFSKIPVLAMNAVRKMASIGLLNDKKLSELMEKLWNTMTPPMEKILSIDNESLEKQFDEVRNDLKEIEKRASSEETKEFTEAEVNEIEEMLKKLKIKAKIDLGDFKKNIGIDEIRKDLEKANEVIVEMNARLDTLAAELK